MVFKLESEEIKVEFDDDYFVITGSLFEWVERLVVGVLVWFRGFFSGIGGRRRGFERGRWGGGEGDIF